MFYDLPSQKIKRYDEFSMPVVNMDLTRSYKDLLDLWFADPLHDDYKIKKMDEKSGIGLENVKRRLDLVYPGKYSLDIKSDDKYTVELKLDLQ